MDSLIATGALRRHMLELPAGLQEFVERYGPPDLEVKPGPDDRVSKYCRS